MQEYHYNFENNTLLKHFLAAFNDIKIKRFNGSRFLKETIKVPMAYAPKSHILADLIGVTDMIKLPAIAIEITGEGRDNARIKNKLEPIIYKNSDGTLTSVTAIPWNMELQMTIMAKYQEDIDQIIHNFSVQATPYVIVSWKEPGSGRELRTEILWNQDVSLQYPAIENHSPKEPPFRITATTSFTIKGYLMKTGYENPKPICLINTDLKFTDSFFCNYDVLTAYIQDGQTDSYAITGRPIMRYSAPYYVMEGKTPTIKIQGWSMNDTIGVFVSGSNEEMYPLTEYQPFTADASFMGYMVENFWTTPNQITFNLPSPSANGFIDVVAVNACGYGKLTEDSSLTNGLTAVRSFPLSSFTCE